MPDRSAVWVLRARLPLAFTVAFLYLGATIGAAATRTEWLATDLYYGILLAMLAAIIWFIWWGWSDE